MKAITLTQPWATLVAIGAKKIETRSWACYYAGPLAIHAAKTFNKKEYDSLWEKLEFHNALVPLLAGADDPLANLGNVLAITNVMACCLIGPNGYPASPAHSVHIPKFTDRERVFGNLTPGRYAWLLGPVRRITPVPARGAQMLWNWDAPTEPATGGGRK